MRLVLLFFMLLGYIWAVDIYEYKKEQKTKEMAISLKKTQKQNSAINIIFYKEFSDSSILESRYPLKLRECIVKKICIFDILDSTIDTSDLIRDIKAETTIKGIKSIQLHREYRFKKL